MAEKGKLRKDALRNRKALIHGKVMSLDPSSSCLGYAVHYKTEKVTSGEWRPIGKNIFCKLPGIYKFVSQLCEKHKPDIVIVEQIRTTARAHKEDGKQLFKFFAPYQLMLAVGAAMAAVKVNVMEMPATSWKLLARRKNIAKTDENDAICIGERAIELAIEESALFDEQVEIIRGR